MNKEKPSTELIDAVFPQVFHKETVAMTDTLKVAKYFERRHDNLLATIKKLGCSDEFNALNFKEAKYIDEKGEKRPMYLMTQDGFTLLVMGFTGAKAMKFKEAYITEFNAMKKWIGTRGKTSQDQHRLNDAIKYIQDHTGKKDKHAYSRENNLIYIIALGATSKRWLRDNGYHEQDEIRQYLTDKQLRLIDDLIAENAVMIKLGIHYNERKHRLQETALHALRKG